MSLYDTLYEDLFLRYIFSYYHYATSSLYDYDYYMNTWTYHFPFSQLLLEIFTKNAFVFISSLVRVSYAALSSLSPRSYYPPSRNLTKTSCFFHGMRNYTPRRLFAALFRRCIFAAMVTGPNVRSSRTSSTLVPERGSSRSS